MAQYLPPSLQIIHSHVRITCAKEIIFKDDLLMWVFFFFGHVQREERQPIASLLQHLTQPPRKSRRMGKVWRRLLRAQRPEEKGRGGQNLVAIRGTQPTTTSWEIILGRCHRVWQQSHSPPTWKCVRLTLPALPKLASDCFRYILLASLFCASEPFCAAPASF